jgi:o-succinylbenzoate synthase
MDRALKITNLHIFEYNLPLAKPFFINKISLTARPGLLVYIVAEDGTTGVGEIAPLEGRSADPYKKALHQAKTMRSKFIGCPLPESLDEIRSFLTFDVFGGWVPAVRCGIEMAFVNLLSRIQKRSPAEVLGASAIRDVDSAALLQGTPEEVKADAERLYKEGVRVFKLKVGSKNIPLDVKKVEEVRAVTGDSKLRLDANGVWRLDEATAFGELVGTDGIEFIEDPIREFDKIDEFFQKTGLPVAVDESLSLADPGPLRFDECVRYFVIKPMMVGGIFRTLQWIAKAKEEGRRVVISSSFESSAGLSMLANLAVLTDDAAGLGTGEWFKEDLLRSPVLPQGGRISKNLLQFDVADIKIEHLTLIN